MKLPSGPLELRLQTSAGRERRLRLRRRVWIALALLGIAAVVALVAGLALVPSMIAKARLVEEMDVALSRRAQLGDRLRDLVLALERLERGARAHADRIERLRILYGLPALPPAAGGERAAAGTPESIFAGAILHGRRLEARIDATLAHADAQLAILARWEREHLAEVRALPVRLPLPPADSVPLSPFGYRRHPVTGEAEFHAGLDLAAPAGARILAPSAGIVRWAGDAPAGAGEAWWRLGRIVVVAHGDRYRSIYGHCERVLVRVGRRVAAGDLLATVGRSGWTPAPRLHYEIRRRDDDGQWWPVDPLSLLVEPTFGEQAAASREPSAAGPEPPPLPAALAR
jgi:murein DD-endopeptidase MepM/ murein hydrolase activator NlpD